MPEYTQNIIDNYWDTLDRTAFEAKNEIENMDEDASPEDWKEQLQKIGKEYTCSARFFLMSYLFENADSISDDSKSYTYSYRGKDYIFHQVSAEYAQQLPDEERNTYIKLLTLIAADNHNDPVNIWKPLMWKAMLRNKKLELLTCQEGYQIAHGLKFNLQQAEAFLLRVLDNDAFCYTRSEDIIEAFCFLYSPANNWHTAQTLKERYHQKTDQIPKKDIDLKPDDFTKNISITLSDRIHEWEKEADMDILDLFMNWLIDQAPILDIPSRSAYKIYRRLTAYAYEITLFLSDYISNSSVSDDMNIMEAYRVSRSINDNIYDNDFADEIEQHCFNETYDLKEEDVYKVASTLLNFASVEFDNLRRKTSDQTWRYLTVDNNGQITAKAIGSRIPALLTGTEAVTKADLLFMLWYTCDLFWTWSIYKEDSDVVLFDRISGFYYVAEELLKKALLPIFYVPHMLERSFLNAICTEELANESPFEIYEGMCEFVLPEKKERKRIKTADTAVTKKSRARLEKTAEDLYNAGLLKFDGLEDPMAEHFLEHAAEKGQYLFTPEGIYYLDPKAAVQNPNMTIAIPYPDPSTGNRFDMKRKDYKDEKVMEERFQFLYGLSLYLMDNATAEYYRSDFRTNYRKNATLSVIKWEKALQNK